jgi:hypothetical protein
MNSMAGGGGVPALLAAVNKRRTDAEAARQAQIDAHAADPSVDGPQPRRFGRPRSQMLSMGGQLGGRGTLGAG